MSASIIPCEVSKLVKSFGRNAVLRGLNLSLQAREITGLIGVNGAGKTTLFRILCGLDGADGGAVYFGDQGVAADEGVRARLSFVAHAPQLYPLLTARENLELFARLRAAEGASTLDAGEALTEVGLGAAMDRPVRTFSRGMAQRVVLARAFAAQPELLILDEPFTALDAAGRAVVVRLLHRMRDDGTSVLLSSHDLDALCEVASRVVHLSGGVLRETVSRDAGEDVDSFRRRVVAVRDGTAPSP